MSNETILRFKAIGEELSPSAVKPVQERRDNDLLVTSYERYSFEHNDFREVLGVVERRKSYWWRRWL